MRSWVGFKATLSTLSGSHKLTASNTMNLQQVESRCELSLLSQFLVSVTERRPITRVFQFWRSRHADNCTAYPPPRQRRETSISDARERLGAFRGLPDVHRGV
jgi:hypothetical protein